MTTISKADWETSMIPIVDDAAAKIKATGYHPMKSKIANMLAADGVVDRSGNPITSAVVGQIYYRKELVESALSPHAPATDLVAWEAALVEKIGQFRFIRLHYGGGSARVIADRMNRLGFRNRDGELLTAAIVDRLYNKHLDGAVLSAMGEAYRAKRREYLAATDPVERAKIIAANEEQYRALVEGL
ncbi:hypothetical protein JQK15_13505 [Sphingobium sp. BHU LFT2]|uniref:hypothetical protein n=1 Tax=Sphingobium sp. BHU LFT2 TaxID=2807634 RepID=UPI001BE8B8A5|nr:hypothetical protein [Sphingobium sp. BHU LFT2]MBT2244555.1 hypothetical protein [Sphingobium sp. BHU LFT2]